MRNLIAPLFALILASCATGSGGSLTKDDIDAIATQVRAGTASLCSYQPDVAAVTQLISQFYNPAEPWLDLGNLVIAAICKAPTTATAVRHGVLRVSRVVVVPSGKRVVVTGVNVK